MKLLVLIDSPSPRAEYIIRHVMGTMLGFQVELTTQPATFTTSTLPRIAYSTLRVKGTLQVVPHGLLAQQGIVEQEIEIAQWQGVPIFFQTQGDLPFDIFAASFYLISRYEEYLPFTPDMHGRFPSAESLAVRQGFHQLPLVDLWVKELGKVLEKRFPELQIPKQDFKFIPTIDVDNAFAYKHKGLVRNTLGFANSLLHFRFADAFRRLLVCFRLKKDPYDSYDLLMSFLPSQTVWFILGGNYSKYDRNLLVNHPAFKKRLSQILIKNRIGIHPSYHSFHEPTFIANQKESIEKVIEHPVTHSRQHFLRFSLPQTHQWLADMGVEQEYSMGYADTIGFRASTCTPFKFYNLHTEKPLPLSVLPFQVMDRALLQGLRLSPTQAVEQTVAMAKAVKEVGGVFITVFHNETQSGINEWRGWEDVLRQIVNELDRMEGTLTDLTN